MSGAAFERHCLYFALRAHMLAEGLGSGDWHSWPQPYQDSRASVVARFARTHADDGDPRIARDARVEALQEVVVAGDQQDPSASQPRSSSVTDLPDGTR